MITDPSSRPRDLRRDHYEAWTFYPRSRQRDITFLGIHIKIEERLSTDLHYTFYGFSASQGDIKNLDSRHSREISASRTSSNATDWLFNLPDNLRQDVGFLMQDRHKATRYDSTPRSWTLHKAFALSKRKGLSSWWKSSPTSTSRQSYLIILRCQAVESEVAIPTRNHNPFPHMQRDTVTRRYREDDEFEMSRRSLRAPVVLAMEEKRLKQHKKQDSEKARKILVSQENAETLVNDFLASISTLYDGVPPEMRRDVLDSIPLPTPFEGDEDSESDNASDDSSDSSGNSLVDD
jgi:hypothetical protein